MRLRLRALAFPLTLILLSSWSCGSGPASTKLVVLVVVDQMRGDFLTRFNDLYNGGFKRLLDDGAVFPDAAYRHAVTVTAAGHATIGTGQHPSHHGVVGNTWWNYEMGKDQNCVLDQTASPVGGDGPKASPSTELVETLGDRLKDLDAESKVVGVSWKDRSAILPAGHKADGAYWFSADCGCFITSSYFTKTVPGWLESFNGGKPADRWAGKSWERMIDDEKIYIERAREDAYPTEADGVATTFPHTMPGEVSKAYYNEIDQTPFADELILEAALAAMDGHDLGQDSHTDVLTVGFSGTDFIGHRYGPFSQEAMDQNLRLDLTLGRLLEEIDQRVGLENVVVALTADHGALPLAETVDGKRISSAEIAEIVDSEVRRRMPALDKVVVSVNAGNVYLDVPRIEAEGVAVDEVETAAIAALMNTGEVDRVYAQIDLEGPEPVNDPFWTLHRNSFYKPRSPQLLVLWKPMVYPGGKFGTGHGSAYDYDRHVPVILFGRGVTSGTFPGQAGPEDIAPTVGKLIGVEVPTEPDTRILDEALAKPAK
ncbi:MAG: alkaline phosphatase family protein [Bryobacterales bacterium]